MNNDLLTEKQCLIKSAKCTNYTDFPWRHVLVNLGQKILLNASSRQSQGSCCPLRRWTMQAFLLFSSVTSSCVTSLMFADSTCRTVPASRKWFLKCRSLNRSALKLIAFIFPKSGLTWVKVALSPANDAVSCHQPRPWGKSLWNKQKGCF